MLELRNIRVTYAEEEGGSIEALKDVSMTFARGSFVVVVGANGSGKSTLLSVIAGSTTVDSGSITLGSRELTSMSEHRRASLIGRVFQSPTRGTVGDMTLRDNLALAASRGEGLGLRWALSRSLQEEMRARLADMGIGLEDRLDRPVASLSGGQRQALTMLMATWHRPEVLLLDEHTAALDPRSADLVMNLTGRIVAERGLTVIMVTHSMQQAVQFGQRLLMLHQGHVVLDITGGEKRRTRPSELVARFEELRRLDRLDESAAALLRDQYL